MNNYRTKQNEPKPEFLQVADIVAREKGIDKQEVIKAIEHALEKTSKMKYGMERDIRVSINQQTGQVNVTRYRKIVEEVANPELEISIEDAKKINPKSVLDEEFQEDLPPPDYGRVAAQGAREVIFQEIRASERAHQYEEFKDRVGEIVNALVKRIEFGNVIVEVGRAEGIIRKDQLIPREVFRVGDRVRAIIVDLKLDSFGPLITLSRTSNSFMQKLFAQEVPEVYDGLITIQAVARDPGSRAKIAVYSSDPNMDPVGACVGPRGARVQAVTNELGGEKVDVVLWSSNTATFIVNALAPAEISKVVLDEDEHLVEVVLDESQLSLAIGRRGQNVKLAAKLTGWPIDVVTESQEIERKTQENSQAIEQFIKVLDVDDLIAQLLVTEGFSTVEELLLVAPEEIAAIQSFDMDVAHELQKRAKEYIEITEATKQKELEALGISKDLLEVEGIKKYWLPKLAKGGVKSRNDLADLSSEELIEILGEDAIESVEFANTLILKAREHWFLT